MRSSKDYLSAAWRCTLSCMDKNASWLAAGAAFGLGFCAICTLVVAGWFWYDTHRVATALEAASRAATPLYRYETRHIAPRDRDTCLRLNDGVANERYWQCRNGYTVRVKVANRSQ